MLRWFVKIYNLLLCLYPLGFRAKFREEMKLVFSEVIKGTAKRGGLFLSLPGYII